MMKFYLAKLRDSASTEPPLEMEVDDSEKEFDSYEWLNLEKAKKKLEDFKKMHNMMEWAEERIRTCNFEDSNGDIEGKMNSVNRIRVNFFLKQNVIYFEIYNEEHSHSKILYSN